MGLNNYTPNAGAPANPATPVPGDNGTMGGDIPGSEQATGEEQASYEKVVMAGLKVLFEDEKSSSAIIAQLKAGADNPAQAIASATTMLMTALDEQSGGQIPEAVILPAAGELLENVAQLANDAGVFPVDQNVVGQAAQLMITSLSEQYGVDPAEVEEMLGSLDEGQLGQIQQEQSQYGGV